MTSTGFARKDGISACELLFAALKGARRYIVDVVLRTR